MGFGFKRHFESITTSQSDKDFIAPKTGNEGYAQSPEKYQDVIIHDGEINRDSEGYLYIKGYEQIRVAQINTREDNTVKEIYPGNSPDDILDYLPDGPYSTTVNGVLSTAGETSTRSTIGIFTITSARHN